MIVMKFGGTSVGSPAAIKRVASIVEGQLCRRPMVVVSAVGDTTDQLAEILRYAARGQAYLSWHSIKDLRDSHLCLAEDLLQAKHFAEFDDYLRTVFRDLHVRMAELSDAECSLTPELSDWVMSIGEQISSRLVAAALDDLGVKTAHLDARNFILTDDQFTHAVPLYWETYAKIRWGLPKVASDRTPVMGGFIGVTEKGCTTTLGRGGSDLTAAIVGAAINADEIQVWKDVDGMLTCDPRQRKGGLLVNRLSYREAAELAQAGAKILHPDTVAPAQRLRIPIVIRNTFRPEGAGTRIGICDTDGSPAIKSIATETGATVLEIRSISPDAAIEECSQELRQMAGRTATFAGMSADTLYLILRNTKDYADLQAPTAGRFDVHVRSDQAILTIVGEVLATSLESVERIKSLVSGFVALVLPQDAGSCALRIALPAGDMQKCLQVLHNALFGRVEWSHQTVDELRGAARKPLELTPERSVNAAHVPLIAMHGKA